MCNSKEKKKGERLKWWLGFFFFDGKVVILNIKAI
jgi:hypothetical protein